MPKANRLAGEQLLRLSPAPVLKVPNPPQRSFVPPQVPSPERPAHPPGQSSVTGPGSEEPVPPRAPGGIWRRGNSSHPGCGKVCPFTVLWHLWGRTCLPHTGQLLQGRMGDSTSLFLLVSRLLWEAQVCEGSAGLLLLLLLLDAEVEVAEAWAARSR